MARTQLAAIIRLGAVVVVAICCQLDRHRLIMSPRTIHVWLLVLWISCCELDSACGREYQLRINHPDGTGFRTESVVEDAEGHQRIEGEIQQSYKEGGILILFYTAGPDGYRTRYTYKAGGASLKGTIQRIGVNALKSTAG